jgi:hypothetical protein
MCDPSTATIKQHAVAKATATAWQAWLLQYYYSQHHRICSAKSSPPIANAVETLQNLPCGPLQRLLQHRRNMIYCFGRLWLNRRYFEIVLCMHRYGQLTLTSKEHRLGMTAIFSAVSEHLGDMPANLRKLEFNLQPTNTQK